MERQRRLIQHPQTTGVWWLDIALIALSSLGTSILLGCIWGSIAAAIVDPGFTFIGTFLGGCVGLLLSPFFLFSAIRSGVMATAIPLFLMNTVLTIAISGLGGEAGPLLSMLITGIVFVATCVYIGSLGLRTASLHIAGTCNTCGYTYLANEVCSFCPPCGQPRPEDLPPPKCLRCGYDLSGLKVKCCPECGAPMVLPQTTPKSHPVSISNPETTS